MESYNRGHSCGMECPECGWGWATSYFSPIEMDDTLYTVNFLVPDKVTISMIRLYAKLTGVNFLQAKEALSNGNAKISAYAKELQDQLTEIQDAELKFTITPDYPYEIDGERNKSSDSK